MYTQTFGCKQCLVTDQLSLFNLFRYVYFCFNIYERTERLFYGCFHLGINWKALNLIVANLVRCVILALMHTKNLSHRSVASNSARTKKFSMASLGRTVKLWRVNVFTSSYNMKCLKCNMKIYINESSFCSFYNKGGLQGYRWVILLEITLFIYY